MALHIYSLAFALAIGYSIYAYIIHPCFISKLAKIPAAHWSCHFTSFWILRARKNGKENASLQDAHRRRGDIVRVAPDTISVDGVEAMRTIYQGGFPKAPWYRVFDNYGHVSSFLLPVLVTDNSAGCLACFPRWSPSLTRNGRG